MSSKVNSNAKRTGNSSSGTAHQNASRRRNRGNGASADWGAADAKLLHRLITAVARMGGAIQFGYTKSQDQYVIRVVGDGEPFNEYLRPTEDVDYWLEGFCEDYELDGTSPPRA